MTAVIEAKGISKRFGGVQALQDVAIQAEAGQVVGLIGPNGAGKSTLVGCLTGLIRIDAGAVFFRGQEITHLSPHQRARLGIGRTFQKLRLADRLTVFENVAAGMFAHLFRNEGASRLRRTVAPVRRPEVTDAVTRALRSTGTESLRDEMVGVLPYGQRHFVELARALVSEPDVLLLDEPATGLTDSEKDRLCEVVTQFRAGGRAVILIEHDLELVGRLCDQVMVVDHGQPIFAGTPAEAQRNPTVVVAYLGTARLGPKGGENHA